MSVENLLAERERLLDENQTLIAEVEMLKVALTKQSETTFIKKQNGDDKQIISEVELIATLPDTKAEESKIMILQTADLKKQIESAIEDIDQCINIISAK